MLEVVDTGINSFARKEQSVAFSVQPSDQLITLTLGQLQDLVQEAIERATAPLEARLQDLQARIEAPQEERGRGAEGGEEAFQDLRARLEALEEATALERAYDRQRLARLEREDPQPLQRDRGEILRALIAANGGKMLAKEARKKMHLSKSRFSELLATMEDYIETKSFHVDKRSKVLLLK